VDHYPARKASRKYK